MVSLYNCGFTVVACKRRIEPSTYLPLTSSQSSCCVASYASNSERLSVPCKVDYTVSGSKNEFGNFTSECIGVLWLLGLTLGALGLWLGGVKSHENERADSVLSTKQL